MAVVLPFPNWNTINRIEVFQELREECRQYLNLHPYREYRGQRLWSIIHQCHSVAYSGEALRSLQSLRLFVLETQVRSFVACNKTSRG